jgi:succinate-semialdehyde dehydrogenase/glutarate-semialdehyde dehydrogenase
MLHTALATDEIAGLTGQAFFKTNALIAGSWQGSTDGDTFAVENPATDEVIAQVANCGAIETEQAITAAADALAGWAQTPAKSRAKILRAWFDLIIANEQDLARLLTIEQGKPLDEALGEVRYGASYIEWFSEEAKRIYGDVIPAPSTDKRIYTLKQPVGVVACITPWNFPSAMLARKIAPALAAGCTVVCKPANETPLSALALGHYAIKAGVPDGVINILCGKTQEIGAALTGSPVVRKLSFTGSTAVGKMLTAACASTMKRTSMELGGNAPFIIFADANLEAALDGLMASKFRNSGQTCVCANRVLIAEEITDQFTQMLVDRLSKSVIGNGLSQGTTIGPLIQKNAVAKVQGLVAKAIEQGATPVNPLHETPSTGNFVPPLILKDVTADMEIFDAEIFGPVATLITFDHFDQAIKLANQTTAGLAAYVYTQDTSTMIKATEQLEFGIVGVNEGIVSNEMAPFGGVKESGHGREGSKYGLDDYLDVKYVCLGGLNSA